MPNLSCPRCKAPIPAVRETELQPADVNVECPAKCGWRGPSYQCVADRVWLPYTDEVRKRPCVKCGQHSLSWSLEPIGKIGYVSCRTIGCGWWAEVI
ncbi:MAG: hypothetical protein IT453_20035 [Planctomycetes bacterium]|nr:hypothetical protein [Planctomycetota bacterium]